MRTKIFALGTRLALAALGLVTAGTVEPAHALLLQPGDSVVYNFDFTGSSPPPPYQFATEIYVFFSVPANGTVISATGFSDLNGAGGIFFTDASPPLTTFSFEIIFDEPDASPQDGVFSVKLAVSGGSLELTTDPSATDYTAAGLGPAVVRGTLVSVPEPPVLLLLLVGLGALLALSKARRINASSGSEGA